ncbi:TonB-dependent receptor plug domain-containing protein [Phenylobacterium sp.]|uniref:TonB-dependent receptor plug domain-containing protein n=1 Tax=Phenylobacterium sp. TaxID=1871053 RepID=UPI0035ADFA14
MKFSPTPPPFSASLRQLLMAGVVALAASPALAQTTPAAQAKTPVEADDVTEVEGITVTASGRLPGAVVGDIPAEVTLTPREIRAYGAANVTELIAALAPQTTTSRGGAAGGRPVVLVNGARVSSFREIHDIPTEAIVRVDILPEEVALKYGYRADQKVVNLVLRRRFNALTAQAGYKFGTASGGADVADIDLNQLTIRDGSRLMIDAKASDQNRLLETDRNLAAPRSDAAYRTLIPDQQTWALNTVLTKPLWEGGAGTVNLSLESADTTSLLGLNTLASGPLTRDGSVVTGHLGGALNGGFQGWRWSATANLDRTETDSATQRILSGVGYRDTSNSVSTSFDSQADISGSPFRLPAGAVNTILTVGYESTKLESDSVRAGVARSGELSRDTASAKLNVDLPLASVRNDVLAGLGDLSVNLNLASDQLSDFGNLSTVGYGFNWSPVKPVRLIASVTRDQGAPTLQQIGDPEQVTPGVQVYDFRTGQTVVISRLDGGNRALDAQEGRVMKLGLNLTPWSKVNLTFSADYIDSRTDNLISSFPSASTQVEAAFPDRFIRSAAGQLIQIDARPVNFDRRDTSELRTGFNYRRSFGPQPNFPRGPMGGAGGDGPPPGGPPPGGGHGFGGPGFGGGGFGGPGGFTPPRGMGMFQIGLYHTVKFTDEITIRPGLPKLDLLDGAAIGSGGGTPKNQVDLQANLTRNGLGASLQAHWDEGTRVVGSGAIGAQDLSFSDLTTVNLRLFADLGFQPALQKHPFFRRSRLVVSIDNLFDEKQTVTASDGTTPVTYQADYLDPRGRTVKVSFRKLF